MSILKVARLGHPVLRKTSDKVDIEKISSEEIQRLIDDMIETMREYDGLGLAAPQVHQSLQISVIESEKNPRYPGAPDIDLTVLINPEITHMSEETVEGWESCLSVEDLRGKVSRSTELNVVAFNRAGEKIELEAKGFIAIVLQHEIDHLNGIVYLDRMKDFKTLSHMKEFQKYWAEK
ncbi:MAG TPA: peptide deformylase [Nitrospinota bacterium]|jgi:peptide deformylase|nr:peptide deformylase [Nitrospinota bacterium]|tara:strand:+ start:119 stop:652 length:534 start_codon:yes stop_codon:yes gene_type:complete